MKLTQEIIDKIQEAMNHTKKDGSINWKDDDEIVVQLAAVSYTHLTLPTILLV